MNRSLLLFAAVGVGLFLSAAEPLMAQFDAPGLGFGFSIGGAYGDNSKADEWALQGRGHLQYIIVPEYLYGQLGLNYTNLRAGNVYTSEFLMADNRFLLVPFSLTNLNPYLYAGIGVAKVLKSGTDYLPMVPVGVGLQTRIANQMLLEMSAGYTLALSDKLDGRTRTSATTNTYTNQKQDGYFGFLVGLTFSGPSRDRDTDNDGLPDKVEKQLGTDPENPDTDGDGLSDGDEVNKYHTDPLKADTDGDGLSDGDEVNKYHTDPLKADTDGDGLSDGDEVNKYHTDPLRADTDGDGLSDGDEVNKYHTDPLKSDTDGDGLSDGDEVLRYRTDPLKADTDGDGLSDGEEVMRYHTDPLRADTDGDGLSDGDEVNKYHTDPLKVDTDGGGVNDGAEIARGTNPLNPADDILRDTTLLEKGKKVVLRGINFETGKATLTKDSDQALQAALDALKANPDVNVEISGHTDNVGSARQNQSLSLRRAQAVKNWLVKNGIPSRRLRTVGKGADEPVADNSTPEGRAENRRIEFYVQQ
ncbi:MAG TPA: OmpA family protein [Bacteroidota bacterium]|nr:OmpA family protein [Bacteroidota bacterium]